VPYTYRSLAFLWLVIIALVAVIASGAVAGSWRLFILVAALASPALILRGRDADSIIRS
jgi:hypothetical protein